MSFFNNDVPSIAERKRAMLYSKDFMSVVNCVVESASRMSGSSPAGFTVSLPFGGVRSVFGASLVSLSLPMNFGTVLYPQSFQVNYQNVVAFPANFTLPIGYYWYNISAGT